MKDLLTPTDESVLQMSAATLRSLGKETMADELNRVSAKLETAFIEARERGWDDAHRKFMAFVSQDAEADFRKWSETNTDASLRDAWIAGQVNERIADRQPPAERTPRVERTRENVRGYVAGFKAAEEYAEAGRMLAHGDFGDGPALAAATAPATGSEALDVGDVTALFMEMTYHVKWKSEDDGNVSRFTEELNKLLAAATAERTPTWKCKANRTADPPQDCDWPGCGCDPHADKVIEALEESGKLGVPTHLSAAIGNVLDHWEQLHNDLRGDSGFESLDRALKQLYALRTNRHPASAKRRQWEK